MKELIAVVLRYPHPHPQPEMWVKQPEYIHAYIYPPSTKTHTLAHLAVRCCVWNFFSLSVKAPFRVLHMCCYFIPFFFCHFYSLFFPRPPYIVIQTNFIPTGRISHFCNWQREESLTNTNVYTTPYTFLKTASFIGHLNA